MTTRDDVDQALIEAQCVSDRSDQVIADHIRSVVRLGRQYIRSADTADGDWPDNAGHASIRLAWPGAETQRDLVIWAATALGAETKVTSFGSTAHGTSITVAITGTPPAVWVSHQLAMVLQACARVVMVAAVPDTALADIVRQRQTHWLNLDDN